MILVKSLHKRKFINPTVSQCTKRESVWRTDANVVQISIPSILIVACFYKRFRENTIFKKLHTCRQQYCVDLACIISLKRHGNEPVFSMFLHKSLWPRSLTLPIKPFRFWLRILGDIRIRKSTPRIGESTTLPGVSIFFKPLDNSIVIVHYIPGLFFAKLVL